MENSKWRRTSFRISDLKNSKVVVLINAHRRT